MKKIYRYISLAVLLTLTWSCEDFLTYKSKDMIVPNKLEHYEQLIFGEMLKLNSELSMRMLDIMTDDVEDFVAENTTSIDDRRVTMSGWYIWGINPEMNMNGSEELDKTWDFFYHKILMSNIIEEELKPLPEGGYKNRLIGEVQFMRALSYFYLVNMYGEPYTSKEQAATAYGVPINTEISIRKTQYKRSKLAEVYDCIDKNLISAIDHLSKGDGKTTLFRPNVDVARLLLSRSYLFQKRYSDAKSMTTELIDNSTASIYTLTAFMAEPLKGCFYLKTNPGILFSWGMGSDHPLYGNAGYSLTYVVSASLYSMFDEKDHRLTLFERSSSGYKPVKTDNYYNNLHERAFRIEEAYLIRAEANIELGELQSALDDINAIRVERINSADCKRESAKKEEVTQYLRDERRMEMCYEEFRWFDIRRWGLEVTHVYSSRDKNKPSKSYHLRAGSPNYTLPIPLLEQRLNANIERLTREETIVH